MKQGNATAFVSYSHADERALERLHKHLAMLKRDGSLQTWTDHKILPGTRINQSISEGLERSTLFLALVSPDYLDSRYCYDTEFQRAIELAETGVMRIIPIILEPCDWLSSPLREFKALPKDGLPVSAWTNQNNAYLDVVTGLRHVLESSGASPFSGIGGGQAATPSGRTPKIKQDFDAIQKAEYADKAYDVIRQYFQGSCAELANPEGQLRAKFEDMETTAFTATLVNRARMSGREAHITVRNAKGRRGFGDISYVYQRYADSNTSNGAFRVDHDDYNLFLSGDIMSTRDGRGKLTAEQAADELWTDFAKQAGVEYD